MGTIHPLRKIIKNFLLKGETITTKKRMTKILAAGMALALMVGTFAFFTDRETHNAGATAGNIDLVFADVSDATAHKEATQLNTDSLVWTDNKITNDVEAIMNPGDKFDMGYKLTNTGSKSIDVRQQLTLVSDVAMTDGAEEYTLKCGNVTITPDVSEDGKTIVYSFADIILNGTVETETDGVAQAQGQDYDLYLDFAKAAANKFMGSHVSVTLDIMAKQHRNTTPDDFVTFAQYTTSFEEIA